MHKLKNMASSFLCNCTSEYLRCSILRPSWPGEFPHIIFCIAFFTCLSENLSITVPVTVAPVSMYPALLMSDRGKRTLKWYKKAFAMPLGSITPVTLSGSPNVSLNLLGNSKILIIVSFITRCLHVNFYLYLIILTIIN